LSIIKIIVGLSNPKTKYHCTRHNAGSRYVYQLAKLYFQVLIKEKKFSGFTSSFFIKSSYVRLFVPDVFMNLNGELVYKIASYYDIKLNEILIIHDDLELKPGIIKLKYSYGHNGHNGLRSVISHFGDKKINFYRLRIGIGRPINKKQVSSFVLSNPTDIENILINQCIVDSIKKNHFLITSIK